jgi:hypothetical protein
MANPVWVGSAAQIKQTYTITMANTFAQNDTITISCDNVDFVVTIGTLVTTAQVATTVKQAFNGETLTDTSASSNVAVADGGAQAIPQFSEMVATVSGSVVTLTARTAGKPFTISVTESTAGTGTATGAAATANAGKHEADNADNWDINAVPLDNDNIYFAGTTDMKYDLSLAVQPASVNKPKSYTGNVGLAVINTDNSSKPYREYRGRYLTSDDNSVTTTLNLETGDGAGSGRFFYDSGAGQAVVNIFGRGARIETGVPCILWKGSHASNVVNNLAGDLGIAWYGAETAVVATLRNGDGPASPAETWVGAGVTLTTVVMNGGKLFTNSALTTGTQQGGEWRHTTGTITTLNVLGGTFYPLGGATVTTLNIGSGGTFDCSKGTGSFTITNTVEIHKGGKFIDPQGRTGNPVLKLVQCKLSDVTIVLPDNKTLTPS